ncbi:pyridoxal-phosphate dependent enzyme [Pseudoduganella rivuli]|nr:pyridoxal-phosphate dependent enzyme [Pseudoduganella rivuli]
MTPLICAKALMPGLKLKVEYHNPSLSMKHRSLPPFVFAMAAQGRIATGSRLAILSAGSAGISVAWAAAQLNCGATVFAPPGVPETVTRYIEWLGSEVVRVAPDDAGKMHARLRGNPAWTLVEQLSEPLLCTYYYAAGLELLAQSDSIAAVTVGAGTAASVMGMAAALRPHGVKVYAVEPAEAAVLQGQRWRPHDITGLAPPIPSTLFDPTAVDGILSVPSSLAWRAAHAAMRATGEAVGPSSGACIEAAHQLRQGGVTGEIIAVCASPMLTALCQSNQRQHHEPLH